MTSSKCAFERYKFERYKFERHGRLRARVIRVLLAALLVSLLGSLVVSCEARSEEASASNNKDTPSEPPVLVKLGDFGRGDVSRRLSVTADLEAIDKADVYPEISGVVAVALKREGDEVKRGESVIQLVDEQLRLEVENKQILAEQAKIKVEQGDVAQREGEKLSRQKQLLLEKAEKEFERLKKLAGVETSGGTAAGRSGIVSREVLDEKRYAVEQARIDAETAELAKEKYRLEYRQNVEDEKLKQVDLKMAEFKLSQSVLRSPIDGVIHYLRLEIGELVSTSQKAFSVISLDRLEARLHVPQTLMADVRPGLDVALRPQVFPDKEFRTTIRVVNPIVDEDKGTIEVLVDVVDSSELLKPGMFVSGEIILETRKDVLLVPKKAISYDNQEMVIFLVRDKKAYRYLLKRGFPTRDAYEVLGLTTLDGAPGSPNDGDLVLIGHDNLKDGTPVEIES